LLADVSLDEVSLVVEDDEVDWSVLVVPLAPMLDEPVELPGLAVLLLPVPLAPMLDVPLELPGLAAVLPLGVVELLGIDELLLGVELVEPVDESVLGVVGPVVEALVPPLEPLEPPLVCAMAMPPMASAAAAANVVSVFLVVVMSSAP
jgi:hypothetical protein